MLVCGEERRGEAAPDATGRRAWRPSVLPSNCREDLSRLFSRQLVHTWKMRCVGALSTCLSKLTSCLVPGGLTGWRIRRLLQAYCFVTSASCDLGPVLYALGRLEGGGGTAVWLAGAGQHPVPPPPTAPCPQRVPMVGPPPAKEVQGLPVRRVSLAKEYLKARMDLKFGLQQCVPEAFTAHVKPEGGSGANG